MNKVLVAAVGLIALAVVQSAQAVPTITIKAFNAANVQIGATSTVADGGAGDVNPSPGQVTALTVDLGGYRINLTSGVTKNGVGGANRPQMDLVVQGTFGGPLATSPFAAGNYLVIDFTEDGFSTTPPFGIIATANAATIPFGTLTYETFVNSTLLTTGTQTGINQSLGALGTINVAGPYSLTQRLTIRASNTFSGVGQSISADAFLQSVPDGGFTLSLLGGSLLALGMVRRKLGIA